MPGGTHLLLAFWLIYQQKRRHALTSAGYPSGAPWQRGGGSDWLQRMPRARTLNTYGHTHGHESCSIGVDLEILEETHSQGEQCSGSTLWAGIKTAPQLQTAVFAHVQLASTYIIALVLQ
jgi:hypothetical protein